MSNQRRSARVPGFLPLTFTSAFSLVLLATACARPRIAVNPASETSHTQPTPAFNIQLAKTTDTITATVEGDRAVFVVTSPSGIGQATIAPNQTWSKTVVFQFQHEPGRPFGSLESLRATSSRLSVAGSVSTSGQAEFAFADAKGAFPSPAPPAGFLNLVVQAGPDEAIARFPDYVFAGRESVAFEWVDFYR